MTTKIHEHLQDKLDALPTKPGVYLMKDEAGQILYVGKAINLRARVRSYFHASAEYNHKIQRLVARIAFGRCGRGGPGPCPASPRRRDAPAGCIPSRPGL